MSAPKYDPDDDRRFKELAATMRTNTGLPICFNCEKVGHTKKVCRIPRRKGTNYEEKFSERLPERSFQSERPMARNFPERGMNRNFKDRGFQNRGFQPKGFPDRGGYQDRIRDRSPISRPSRLFSERDNLPYRRPSPPSFSQSSDILRRLDVSEAEVRCERLEDHMRKLQDELLELRAEARTSHMVQSRPRPMQMPTPERGEFEEEGQMPEMVKTLAKILRTDDNQPICFECAKPGHTRRFCYFNN